MSSSDYRAKARQILAGKWGMAILVTFVAGILGALLTSSSSSFDIKIDVETMQYIPEALRNLITVYLTIAGSIGGALGLAQFIVGGTVKLGYCKYLLKLHDGEEGEIRDLFSQFDRFADGFILSLLTGIYTFLWSLLFIIPGIVAAYKYSMAPFIMQENPGMKPSEAIDASKKMMDGHKGELFILDLSFIGWMILSAFTMGIGDLWLNPYMNVARTAFYRNLSPARVVMETPTYVIPEAPEYAPAEVVEETTPEE